MEAGQKCLPAAGPCAYYVVAGSAHSISSGQAPSTGSGQATLTASKPHLLPAGQIAEFGPGEAHTIANAGQGRLICLVIQGAE